MTAPGGTGRAARGVNVGRGFDSPPARQLPAVKSRGLVLYASGPSGLTGARRYLYKQAPDNLPGVRLPGSRRKD